MIDFAQFDPVPVNDTFAVLLGILQRQLERQIAHLDQELATAHRITRILQAAIAIEDKKGEAKWDGSE